MDRPAAWHWTAMASLYRRTEETGLRDAVVRERSSNLDRWYAEQLCARRGVRLAPLSLKRQHMTWRLTGENYC